MPEKCSTVIYTDGSCHGNPGPGGYAAIVLYPNGTTVEVHGSDWYTTNNRMELTAVIEGLKILSSPSSVTIVTDSKYVANAINSGRMNVFCKEPKRKNVDLWRKVLKLSKFHKLSAKWVKGHAGNPLNEKCDRIANEEVQMLDSEKDIRQFTFAELLKNPEVSLQSIVFKYQLLRGLSVDTEKIVMDAANKYKIQYEERLKRC